MNNSSYLTVTLQAPSAFPGRISGGVKAIISCH